MARFQREAEVLASLNHSNIAAIYGLEEGPVEAGHYVRALVMELVEGPTLADRIASGPMPLEEVLPIAKQIARALDAAHEQGIVHRDLKPANVKVRPDGTVKVLDFGLAQALTPDIASMGAGSPSMSPTITTPAMTQAGMILGTAAYMNPEQARGRPVDRRADIWAFGCVLYEMLAGRRAFDGDDVTVTLARVVEREPDLDALPPGTPDRVRRALGVCLRKDPKQRASAMHDVWLALDGAFDATVDRTDHAPIAAAPPPWWRRVLPLAATAMVAGVIAGGGVWMARPAETRHVDRFYHVLPEGGTFFTPGGLNSVAVAPDGRHVAYSGSDGLRIRPLDTLEDRLLIGSPFAVSPFFSPDGRTVGFFDIQERRLSRVPISGGVSLPIVTVNVAF